MDALSQRVQEAVAISALQHYSYCPRQCALIHIEQTFDENVHTLRGRSVHEHVDTPESRIIDGKQVERALPLFSNRLGLVGIADVVEILPDGTPYPVEYKYGRRRPRQHDDIQLAAQAICLEEMTGRSVRKGAIYHHSSRRRREVDIGPELRTEVERIVAIVREMLHDGVLPPPENDARCRHCSLKETCQPAMIADTQRLQRLRADLFIVEDDLCDNS